MKGNRESVWKGPGSHQTVREGELETVELKWPGRPWSLRKVGQKPGHFLQAKSADRDIQCPPGTLISLQHSNLAGTGCGQCGLGPHMALDFVGHTGSRWPQHLRSLVNYLTLNKKPARHILQAAIVPNHDLKKVICVTLFQHQSVQPECFIITRR